MMKTKKRALLIVSMLVFMLALCGCETEEKEHPFDYGESAIAVDTMGLFQQYSAVPDDMTDYYMSAGTEFEQSAIKGINQARNNDKVGEFQDFNDIINGTQTVDSIDPNYPKFEEGEDYVMVTVLNKAANRDVEITVKYVENAKYYLDYTNQVYQEEADIERQSGMTMEQYIDQYGADYGIPSVEAYHSLVKQMLMSQGVYPYTPVEMVVSPVYSKSEMMKQAGTNTLTGMGVVFCVLIFISFVISLLKFLPALLAKKPKVPEEKKNVPADDLPKKTVNIKQAAPPTRNPMDDAELVAVITAAVYAAAGAGGMSAPGAVSKDKLVVRSIRRV